MDGSQPVAATRYLPVMELNPDEAQPTSEDSPFICSDPTWWDDIPGTRMVWQMEGVLPWEVVLTGFTGPFENYQLAGLRMKRKGGPLPCDYQMHRVLFSVLGAITLVSGHIELEMKRILLTARAEPDSGFADVDLTWKKLEDALEVVAGDGSPLGDSLKPVLAWARDNRLRDRRNTAVHSAWSLYETGHIEGARLPHRSEGQTIIDAGGDLSKTVSLLWEYLNRLQALVKWPIAVLPSLSDDTPLRNLIIEVEGQEN